MYSTGNYTQYLVVTYKKIYIELNHVVLHLKATQHCKMTIFQLKIIKGDEGMVLEGIMLNEISQTKTNTI